MGKTLDKQALDRQRFFFDHYGVTENDLEHYLAAALSAGGDYADLYFEYLSSTSLMVDESMVKSASQGISAGCGVRVVSGERTGAYCRFDCQRSGQDFGRRFPEGCSPQLVSGYAPVGGR